MTFVETMKKPSRPSNDFEVVIVVFKCENEDRMECVAQTSLFFNDIDEMLDWAGDSGVDFT